jgi:hypothetical protein
MTLVGFPVTCKHSRCAPGGRAQGSPPCWNIGVPPVTAAVLVVLLAAPVVLLLLVTTGACLALLLLVWDPHVGMLLLLVTQGVTVRAALLLLLALERGVVGAAVDAARARFQIVSSLSRCRTPLPGGNCRRCCCCCCCLVRARRSPLTWSERINKHPALSAAASRYSWRW